jgi:hypothetical protein
MIPMELADSAALAATVSIAVGLMKIIEHLIDKNFKKDSEKKEEKKETERKVVISVDSALGEILSQNAEKINDIHKVMSKTDNDGSPLVYSSRTSLDLVRTIAAMLHEVSINQERLAKTLEKLEDKLVINSRQ